MTKLERVYNVPLRREFLKVPRYKRSKKAIFALTAFIAKHMKTEDVRLGKYVNEEIWKCGIKSPPHHVKVTATRDEKGVCFVELVGAPVDKVKDKKKTTKKTAVKKTTETKNKKVEDTTETKEKKVKTPKKTVKAE